MNDATDTQSSIVAPKRRSRLADFFVRLVREKPLGTISGIIVFIFIFVAIFADSPQIHRLTAEMGSGGADNVLVSEFVGGKSLDLMVMRV